MKNDSIAENIGFLLKYKNLTQNEFGELFGLKRGLIANYVRDHSKPKIEIIVRIAEHFNISLDDFIKRPITEKDLSVNKKNLKEAIPNSFELMQESLNANIEFQKSLVQRIESLETEMKGIKLLEKIRLAGDEVKEGKVKK